jgi:hypothetical protein
VIAIGVTLVLGGVSTVLIVTVFSTQSSETHSRTEHATSFDQWISPEPIDWAKILAVPVPKLGLMAPASTTNLPVKGTLTVRIDSADIAQLPETINVYQIIPMVSSCEELENIARRFGLSGPVVNYHVPSGIKGETILSYSWGRDSLEYSDRELQKYPTRAPAVPSESECQRIAWRLARRFGLLSPNASIIGSGGGQGGIISGGPHTLSRTVVIRRTVDGYDVRGIGM